MNQVVCIACDVKFMNDVNTNTNVLETQEKIFRSCSKYFSVELDRIPCSLNINLTKEPLPFCSNCFLSAHKVLTLHEQIEVLEREINKIVSDLKTSILKCCQQENVFSSSFPTVVNFKKDDIDDNCTATLQEKVRHYRHLVLSASGLFQDVGVSEYVPPICEVDIKHETVYDNIECEFSGDMLMDHHSENNESEHEWESIASGKQKCQAKVLPPSETMGNSILQLMRFYGMDKRKLVINLNRDSVLQFPKSNSAYLKKELRNNSYRIKKFSNRRGSNLQVRPSWTKDGFKICCGIKYIPTNDGQQQCGACNKIFSDATRLTRHIRIVHAGLKPKSYHKPKLTSKAFKVVTNDEGKTSYAGVEFFELEMGKIKCGNCHKICPTVDAILRHIRWYHLGDTATEMYRQRREVYKLKRMSVLGKEVPKEKLEKVEKALKEKLYVTTIVKKAITTGDTEILTPSCFSQASSSSAGESKSPLKIKVKKNRKFTFDKTEIKKVKKSNIQWKDDSEEENDIEPPFEDNTTEDPDFSPVGSPCGSVQLESSNTEDEESDGGMNDIKKDRNEYKVVKRRDGKKFYCDIELIVTEDGQQKCGKCNIQLETPLALCRHIEDVHKPQKEDEKLSKSRSTQNNRRHSKIIKGRKKSQRKSGSNRRSSESREQEKVVDKDGKMMYRGVELKILEDGKAECGVCQRISIGKRALLRHICKNHAFEKQFAKLPKAENSNNKIYRGVELWDTKDDRLACGRCWKSFVALDDLMRHIRTLHYSLKHSEQKTDMKEEKKEGEDSELKTYFTDEGFVYNGVLCKKSEKDDGYNCGFPCDVRPACNREYSSSYRLVNHIKKDHLVERVRINRKRIVTTEDGRKTYAGIELVILDDGRAECGKCKKISPHKSALIRHIYAYHDSYIHERQFSKLPSSENGKRIYQGVEIADTKDGQFACGSCWRCFRSVDDVKRHIREHHQKSKNKNKVEIKVSKNVDESSDKKSKINEESKKTNKTSKTNEEEKEPENGDDEAPTGETSEGNDASKVQEEGYFTEEGFVYNGTLCKKLESGSFVCGYSILKRPLCGKEFATTFTLVNHIHKMHVGNMDKKPTSRYVNRTVTTEDGRKIYAGVEIVKMDGGNMQCGACQKVFNRLSSVMSHIIRVHEQKGGHFICRYCGKNCGYKFWLVAHELRHTEDKKFTCEDCGLSYKQMSSLLHHKRQVHLKIKRHTCQICGKGYYHTRDFLLHQRRHTGEKPFQCCFCGKDFYSVYEMKNHEKVHNNDQLTNKKQQSRPERTTSEESFKSKEKHHHGATKPMRITRKTKSKKNVGGFECDYCAQVFKTSASVKKHEREEHSDSTSENEDDPSSTLEMGENPPEKRISAATVSQNYSSQQNFPTSSWHNPMPVLENMNPIKQSVHNSQHGPFPPLLTPMYHPLNNTTPLFNPFPPQNY